MDVSEEPTLFPQGVILDYENYPAYIFEGVVPGPGLIGFKIRFKPGERLSVRVCESEALVEATFLEGATTRGALAKAWNLSEASDLFEMSVDAPSKLVRERAEVTVAFLGPLV